jgi:hypothetical protein
MRRRRFLHGSIAAAITAACGRLAGAVASMRSAPPATPPTPTTPRFYEGGNQLDRMWRDMHRRLIDTDYFVNQAFDRAIAILGKSNRGELTREETEEQMFAVHSEALHHPPPEREIPGLPADQVGVGEVMAVLRRAIRGDSSILVDRPWREFFHGLGDFEIDGWKMRGFKRSDGIKYLDRAVSADGRVGTYESWEEREGNPILLLADREQDSRVRAVTRSIASTTMKSALCGKCVWPLPFRANQVLGNQD